MKRILVKHKVKYFITASMFTVGLLAMSILLKSETPFEEEVIAEAALIIAPTVYDEPITLVASKGKLRKDYYQKHIKVAKQIGVGSLKDTSAIQKFVQEKRLTSVVSDRGYILGDMTHSYPYLTEEAILVLRKIGASFYQSSGDCSAFTVSSLARTENTQKKLRKHNHNATKKESSHCYGVSFDISYIRYNGTREWSYERTKTLEGILATMQKNGEIYVLKERNQSCFHITVRNKKTI